MQDNKTFLSMINSVLNTDGLYFATDYDLTHSLQRLANTSPEFQEMTLLERVRHTHTHTHTHTHSSLGFPPSGGTYQYGHSVMVKIALSHSHTHTHRHTHTHTPTHPTHTT